MKKNSEYYKLHLDKNPKGNKDEMDPKKRFIVRNSVEKSIDHYLKSIPEGKESEIDRVNSDYNT